MTPCLIRQGTELESLDKEAVTVLNEGGIHTITVKEDPASVLTNPNSVSQIFSVSSPECCFTHGPPPRRFVINQGAIIIPSTLILRAKFPYFMMAGVVGKNCDSSL